MAGRWSVEVEVMKLDLVEMGLVPARIVREVESEGVDVMIDCDVVFVEAGEGGCEGGARGEARAAGGRGEASRGGGGQVGADCGAVC